MTTIIETNDTPALAILQARIEALEAQLAEAEHSATHFRRIAEAVPSLLYVFDLAAQRFCFTNHELLSPLGYSLAESQQLGAATLPTLMHPDDLPRLFEHDARLTSAADGEVLQIIYRMRHKNGEWRTLANREVVFARDASGNVTQKLGTVTDISDHQRRDEELLMFKALFEHSPEAIGVSALTGTQIYANPALRALLGYGPELIGMPYTSYVLDDNPETVQALIADGMWRGPNRFKHKDGSTFTVDTTSFIIRDASGQPQAMGGLVRDMTEQVRAEAERAALQQRVFEAQEAALRELSTPLIPLAAGLVVMPLIGAIDSRRAQQVIDELLAGVAHHHAQTVILDITGVPVVDTQVAGALLRAAQAVKLLGARVVLTGIRPEIAQTLVSLGLDLQSLITHGSLQSGVAFALARLGSRSSI